MRVQRVLLIDDEQAIRAYMRDLNVWKQMGCCIVGEAGDGAEGLRLIESLRPHIVITDVVMPELNGLEMIERARSIGGVRFIIMSGYQEFGYVQQALRSGVADYILKPVSAGGLRDALARICEPEGSVKLSDEERYGSIVAGVMRCVEEHLADERLTLLWICENELFMNETYVGRLFQRRVGLKFSAYLAQRRLEAAKALLRRNRDISIGDASAQLGFGSVNHFIDFFKKMTGKTPGQYKKEPD